MGPDAMIFVFWMLNFKPVFSLSTFTFIKRLFSSSSLSAIRVVSSAHLRLLIFLPEILISACASSSLAFHIIYSAYTLNKQGDNIQPWRTPFLNWNQCGSLSGSNCCFLTCIQISQEASQVVWYSHLFQNFPQFVVIHTVDRRAGKITFENDKGNLEKENFCPHLGSDLTGKQYSWRQALWQR